MENQKNNKIIHIASHALFRGYENKIEDSMLRRIVFSGANFPDANPLDDIFNGIRNSKIRLGGYDLVVISACEWEEGNSYLEKVYMD